MYLSKLVLVLLSFSSLNRLHARHSLTVNFLIAVLLLVYQNTENNFKDISCNDKIFPKYL